MIDESVLKAIETLGYPIVSALLIGGIAYNIIKFLMKQFDRTYSDNRKDIKEIIERVEKVSYSFNETVKDIAKQYADQTKVHAVFQQKVLAGLDRLSDEYKSIIEVLRQLKETNNKQK